MVDAAQNAEDYPTNTTAAAAESSPAPRKRLLAGLDHEASSQPPDSASSVEPDPPSIRGPNPSRRRARHFPKISECHACGKSGTLSGGPGGGRKLRALKSGWRVVLLCRSCIGAVDSWEVCSYCLLKLSEPLLVFSCVECRRLVHQECGLRQRNFVSCSGSQSFVCIDCWVPNSTIKVRARFRVGSNGLKNSWPGLGQTDRLGVRTSAEPLSRVRSDLRQSPGRALSDSCSAKGSKGSLFGDPTQSMEEVTREAHSDPKMAVAAGTLAKEKTSRKSENARKAAAVARAALNTAAVAAMEENSLSKGGAAFVGHCSGMIDAKKEADGGISDEKLALQLHRAMNSSPRIRKNNYVNRELSSLKEGEVCIYRRRDSNFLSNLNKKRHIDGFLDKQIIWSRNDSGDSSKSESGSHSIFGRFEACTEDTLFENPDRPEVEPSVGLDPPLGAPLTDADTNREHTYVYKTNRGKWKIGGGCDGSRELLSKRSMENGVDGFEGDHLSSREDKFDVQVKEEQASCSNKPANSSGDDDSLDTEFESCQNQNVVLSTADGESAHCEDEAFNYCKMLCTTADESCSSQARNRRECSSNKSPRKYSRRCLGVKGVPHKKTKPLSEDLFIENQA